MASTAASSSRRVSPTKAPRYCFRFSRSGPFRAPRQARKPPRHASARTEGVAFLGAVFLFQGATLLPSSSGVEGGLLRSLVVDMVRMAGKPSVVVVRPHIRVIVSGTTHPFAAAPGDGAGLLVGALRVSAH